MIEVDRNGIIWRFGAIGIILYYLFHHKKIWDKKGFVFISFSLSFIVVFLFIGFLILKVANINQLWLLSIVLIGIAYGIWAEKYFSK